MCKSHILCETVGMNESSSFIYKQEKYVFIIYSQHKSIMGK